MNIVHRIENWGDSHHPRFLDLIRIVLGIFLLIKGITFMENTAYLKDIILSQNFVELTPDLLIALVYYVAFAHMAGGALIALGIMTRFASLIQIPILIGAVFFVNIFQEPINTLAWPSIVALILLLIFTVIGSGPLSLERYCTGCNEKQEDNISSKN